MSGGPLAQIRPLLWVLPTAITRLSKLEEWVAISRPMADNAPMSLSTILLIFAFIAFVLAAIGWGYKKTNLMAIGLALWVLSILVTQVHLG